MSTFLSLLVVGYLLQFSFAVKVVRVFCFEDHKKNTTKFITDDVGTNTGVEVHERFHVVIKDSQVAGDVITIVDRESWPSIVGDTTGKLRKIPGLALNAIAGKLAPKLIASLTDKGIADAATIIYEEGNENEPESFQHYEVEVIDCTSKSVSLGLKTEYTVKLRFKNPLPSRDKLTISLVNNPFENGIDVSEAPGVEAKFGKEVVGLPVTFFDSDKAMLKRNWNRKMYLVEIPPLSVTKNQITEKLRKIPGSSLFKVEEKFSEPLVFRIAVGGKGEAKGREEMDGPSFMLKHLFSNEKEAGFLVDGACAA